MKFRNKKSPRDYRDIKLGMVQEPSPYPEEYETDISWWEQLWQNGYPMCGAHAAAHFKAILDHFDVGGTLKYSPVYFWEKLKLIDGTKPENGTYMRAIFKVLQKTGICDYDLFPTDYRLSLEQLSEDNTTKEQDENAQLKVIKSYAFGNTDFESIKQDIYKNKAVLLLSDIGDTWWRKIFINLFTKKDGGHFYVAYGYTKSTIKIIDSADKAEPKKQLVAGYKIRESGTAIDIPNDVVLNLTKQLSLLERVVKLLKQLKGN